MRYLDCKEENLFTPTATHSFDIQLIVNSISSNVKFKMCVIALFHVHSVKLNGKHDRDVKLL